MLKEAMVPSEKDIITLNDIQFSYSKRKQILENCDLSIKKGMIYCLIGPNGAGKSTLMKLLVGILKPSKGSIHVFGKELSTNKYEILEDTFLTLESPSFYNNLSGYDNLKIICHYRCFDKSKIDEALDLFALERNKKFRNYSQGMKQRLVLAAGFLFKPNLMILDEPFNGLDPGGVINLRNQIIKLNQTEGISFLISSHLLREMASFCTHYGILNNKKVMESGEIEQSEAGKLEERYVQILKDYKS